MVTPSKNSYLTLDNWIILNINGYGQCLSVDKNINSRESERYFSSNKEVFAIWLVANHRKYVFLDQAWLNRLDITVYYQLNNDNLS